MMAETYSSYTLYFLQASYEILLIFNTNLHFSVEVEFCASRDL